MAQKALRKPVKRAKSKRKRATIPLIIAALLAATALPLFLLMAAGLVPSGVAAIVDRHPRRFLARTVMATNLAGMAPAVMSLWHLGINLDGAEHVLSEPIMWLIMYGSAGLGWLIYIGTPFFARALVDHRADQMQHRLEKRADLLIEEWGEEVSGRKEARG